MVFHRFLEARGAGRVRIRVNGKAVEPWNPFAISEEHTRSLGEKSFEVEAEEKVYGVQLSMAVLPPRSLFSSQEAFERMSERNSGGYEGIGISFEIRDGYITVITAIEGGPSSHLGIRPGDRIVEIEGDWMKMGTRWYTDDQLFLAAIVESPIGNLFIRFAGDRDTVEANRHDFAEMIRGLKAHHTG